MTPNLDGWIPFRAHWAADQFMVDWCYLARRTFREPFFDQTIAACIKDHLFNLLFRRETPIATLVEHYRQQPGLRPTGFIFHMSRSGSTLISRMFAALSRNIVISEAPPLDAILKSPFRSPVSEEQAIEWLRAMVSALGQRRLGGERNLFIKFEAWHALMLPIIRKAFPDVPWIFAYRDPVDVLVSQMEFLGQAVPNVLHQSLFGNHAKEVASLPPEDYYSIVLATFCDAALKYHLDGGLLVNYTQLPEAVCTSISEFFDVGWTVAETETMKTATARHSKHHEAFKPDSEVKQANATPQIRDAAQRWLAPIYEQLENARRGGAGIK